MSISLLLSLLRLLSEVRWDTLKRISRILFKWYTPGGLYEVFNYQVELELCDSAGRQAIYRKHQDIRFLQDNVMAYADKVWGDGDILSNYTCSPGVPVDCYKDGYRHQVLISLREVKHKNERETIHIERHIRNGFTQTIEELQTDVDHYVHKLSMTIVFPAKRHPQSVYLFEKNSGKGHDLNADHFTYLPNNRLKVTWQIRHPQRYTSYVLRWTW